MNSATISPSQDSFLPPVPCSQAHCQHLETQITELSAHIHAATYRLLELIREYDDSHGWTGPGLNSSATAPALLYLLHPCSRVHTG
jgi:hypothetical protein